MPLPIATANDTNRMATERLGTMVETSPVAKANTNIRRLGRPLIQGRLSIQYAYLVVSPLSFQAPRIIMAPIPSMRLALPKMA